MPTATRTLLDVTDPRTALRLVDRAAPGLRDQLEVSLRDALRGRPGAVRAYVRAYEALVERLLASMGEVRPELFVRDEGGHLAVRMPRGRLSRAPIDVLRGFAADAPFSPWVTAKGARAGVALDLLSRIRALLPGLDPLPLPSASAYARPADDPDLLLRFTRRVMVAVQGGASDLSRVSDALGLSRTELGRLFGVSRQAASGWLADGPPAARAPKAACVAAIADLLVRRLKPARVPGVVRAKAPAYGDLSMLDLIAADRHQWLLDSVRRSFDYAATA